MRHILNIRAFKIIATMDEMMDKEISFLEKSCEPLSRDIEMYSTPTDKRAQARDSGIATMVGASGGQSHLKSRSVKLATSSPLLVAGYLFREKLATSSPLLVTRKR